MPSSTQSASSFLLLSLAMLVASVFLFLAPYGAISNWWSQGLEFDRKFETALEILSPVIAWVLFVVFGSISDQRQRRILLSGNPISWSEIGDWPYLDEVLSDSCPRLLVLGNIAKDQDPGGSVLASPYVWVPMHLKEPSAVVFPALAWSRLSQNIGALAAVTAHELGHIVNRDARWIVKLELALKCSLLTAALIVTKRLLTSSFVDLKGGENFFAVIQANVAGKSSDLALLAIVILGVWLVRMSQSHREYMADQFAINSVGLENLRAAEGILEGSEIVGDRRRWRSWSADRTLVSSSLLISLGAICSILAAYTVSPFAYFCQTTASEFILCQSNAFAASVQSTVAYVALLLVAMSATNSSEAAEERVPSLLFLVIIGWVGGFLASQSVPLSLSALPIFDDFANIHRHNTFALFLGTTMDRLTVITTAALVAFSIVCIWRTKGRIALLAPFGIVIVTLGYWEPIVLNLPTFGLLAPSLFLAVLLATVLFFGHPSLKSNSQKAVLALLSTVAVGSWFGLGGPSSPAIGFQQSAWQQLDQGNVVGGLSRMRMAARLAPLNSSGWQTLAETLYNQRGDPSEIIAATARAYGAPYLSDWSEISQIEAFAGAVRLEFSGSEADLLEAKQLLHSALDRWRRSVKIRDDVGVLALYNLAAIEMRLGKSRLLALTWLLEASEVRPDIILLAIEDPDFADLNIAGVPNPDPEFVQQFLGDSADIDIILRKAAESKAFEEQALLVVSQALRCRAAEAGVDMRC